MAVDGRLALARLIYRFGEYASRWCIVAGAAAGFFTALAKADYFWIANVIYLAPGRAVPAAAVTIGVGPAGPAVR